MADFTLQITNFEKYGTYNYRFDEIGNVILNPSSSIFQQNFISIPLSNINYNTEKVSSFYDPTFTEFVKPVAPENAVSSSVEITDQLNAAITKNQELQSRLDSLILENEQVNTAANIQVVRDIILALRIQLGQGFSTADFQSEFPYLPLSVEQRDNAQ